MSDFAVRETDKTIKKIDQRLQEMYEGAQKDLEKKTSSFWARHKVKDAKYRKQLAAGEITKEDYQGWMQGQIFQGKQWEAQLKQVQDKLAQTNKEALSILNSERIPVFALNSNWTAFELESGVGVNFGFSLYDNTAVARLIRDNPDLLPAKKLNEAKDKKWNVDNMNRQIMQGILQGESLETISKRLANVTDTNKKSMLSTARTMMTSAQNAGRQERYENAQKIGVKLKKVWVVTLDEHTRKTHQMLDGQEVDVDKPFKVDGYTIMYPGDPHAKYEMIWGCRCTIVSKVLDYPDEFTQRRDNVTGELIENMTYNQWKSFKSAGGGV